MSAVASSALLILAFGPLARAYKAKVRELSPANCPFAGALRRQKGCEQHYILRLYHSPLKSFEESQQGVRPFVQYYRASLRWLVLPPALNYATTGRL